MDQWATEKANLRDILSHTSGLSRHDFSYSRLDNTTSVLARQRFLKPAFELRERFSYTNQMYAVGAHIVSKYAGSFTTYSVDEAVSSGNAAHVFSSFGRRIPLWFSEAETELDAGPGGVNSNANDLMLLNSGANAQTNASVIPAPILNQITTAGAIFSGNTTTSSPALIEGYGMGWFRYTLAGLDIIDHDGSIPGISTYIGMVPSANIGIIVLINANGQTDVYNQIKPALLGEISGSNITSQHSLTLQLEALPVDYTGTYHADGYGDITLCSALSESDQCTQVL
ncbi:beta-lactamase/transpeptidase-like protein [Amylostereum chailletii]|nr:beta-lactamase/transpeptidase-like protein [Amylostereum chailletii]